MKNFFLSLSILLTSTITGFSQTESDTLLTPTIFVNIDSIEAQNDTTLLNQEFSNLDSLYTQRLHMLPFQFSLTYNPMVRRYIELYTVKIKEKVQFFIGLSDFYFPIISEVLKSSQLPDELKYIPIIESALNPMAVSRARAVGLWQFMKGTGRENKLIINNLVDQRRSLLESTKAAAKYLRFLHNMYGDWQLVLAAYNCGPGRVNRAIHRSGGKRDFWEIYRYLPRETRGYVPEYIGAVYAFNFYKEHNIIPVPTTLPLQTDTILINKQLHLGQVSGMLGIDLNLLRAMNPQYLKDMIPAPGKIPYSLRIPMTVKPKFTEMKDSIYAYRYTFYKNEFLKKEKSQPSRIKAVTSSINGTLLHRVQSGESLWIIAGLYQISVADLKAWNNITENKIKPGQKLVVAIPKKS